MCHKPIKVVIVVLAVVVVFVLVDVVFCLVPGVAKLCKCRMPDECDRWCMYIRLAWSDTGQDVIAGASM